MARELLHASSEILQCSLLSNLVRVCLCDVPYRGRAMKCRVHLYPSDPCSCSARLHSLPHTNGDLHAAWQERVLPLRCITHGPASYASTSDAQISKGPYEPTVISHNTVSLSLVQSGTTTVRGYNPITCPLSYLSDPTRIRSEAVVAVKECSCFSPLVFASCVARLA